MKLVTLMIIFHSIKCYYGHTENATISMVIRRYSVDIYYYNSRESGKPSVNNEVCNDSQPTYMVDERRCVKNEDFFDGNWYNNNIIS
jgi:hypothetical protein